MSNEVVTLNVLDREYTIGCPPEKREQLIEAARFLDTRMRDIRANARNASLDQVAVLAALNITHEYHQLQRDGTANTALNEAIDALEGKLSKFGDQSLF